MLLDFLKIRARGRLFATQAGEPHVKRFQRFHERRDFAKLAARRGVRLIEQAALGFLLLYGFFREHVHQVQVPVRGKAVAKFVGLGKVVAGFEKKHRNLRQALAEKIKNDDVLRLKTASKASSGGL